MILSHITYVMVNRPSATSQPVITRTKYFKSNLIVLSTVDLWSRNEVSPYYVFWIPGRGFRIRSYCNQYLAPDSHHQRDSGFLELNFGFRKPLILDSTSKNLPVRIAVHRAICLFNNLKSCSTSAAGTRASLSFFFFQSWPVKLLALFTKRFIVWQHRSTDFFCGPYSASWFPSTQFNITNQCFTPKS